MPINMVPLSKEDKMLMRSLYECKGYSAQPHFLELEAFNGVCLPICGLKIFIVLISRRNMHGIFFVWSLKDYNNKQTYMTRKPCLCMKTCFAISTLFDTLAEERLAISTQSIHC